MRASSGSASEEPAPEGAEAGRASAGGRFAPLRALALSGGRALLRGGSSWTSFSRSSRAGLPNRALGARRLVGLAFAVLALRLLHLQVVEHERLFELAKDNILREEVLPAIRGVVRAREGREARVLAPMRASADSLDTEEPPSLVRGEFGRTFFRGAPPTRRRS